MAFIPSSAPLRLALHAAAPAIRSPQRTAFLPTLAPRPTAPRAFSRAFRSSNLQMVEKGAVAPDFSLPDQSGASFTLSSLRGRKNIVLFFYPKDDTPGCTKEACAFRDAYEEFKQLDAEVVGISADADHGPFARKYGLGFTLLSDVKNEVRKLYKVPAAMGFLPGRVTYVIDKEGIVKLVFNSMMNAEQHVEEARRALKM